jgi:hypothetical protein
MNRCHALHPNDTSALARVGYWHWSTYWAKWSKLIRVGPGTTWCWEDCDGKRRIHCTTIDARYFADQPFDVYATYKSRAPL